jgi:hypothetical protein
MVSPSAWIPNRNGRIALTSATAPSAIAPTAMIVRSRAPSLG